MSNIIETVELGIRLREINRTVARAYGEKWAELRDEWIAVICAKAAQENKADLAAAIELAKAADRPEVAIVILAAGYELAATT